MSTSLAKLPGIGGFFPPDELHESPSRPDKADVPASAPRPSPQYTVSDPVVVAANILHRRSSVVSAAEFEAYEWRHQRAVACVWIGVAALLSAEPLRILGDHIHSAPLSFFLSFGPMAVVAASALQLSRFRRRRYRLSSARVVKISDGWLVHYSFRGYFRRIRRQRLFVTDRAAESFFQPLR